MGKNEKTPITINEVKYQYEDLTQEQQEDYVASYSKIHGQSLEQTTSHKFEEIGGNFNSAIGHNQSQSIFGSKRRISFSFIINFLINICVISNLMTTNIHNYFEINKRLYISHQHELDDS
jgi:hypothetical protein